MAGVPLEEAERLWMELGFPPVEPDVTWFTEADAEVLGNVAEFRQWDVIGFDDIVSMTRVLGQALARAAGAQARLTLSSLPAGQPSSPEDDEALEAAVTLGAQVSERFLSYVWRRHLAAALGRAVDPRPTEVVGFVDLVGYTELSARLDPDELPELLGRFQQVSSAHVAAQGGRIVKLIGDAVMFVAPEPRAAALAALGLRDALAEDDTSPAVRIGMAVGPLVHLEGDVYGDTVNRASRIAELARRDTILVDDDVAAALAGDPEVSLRPLRPHRLKGIGLVRCWVLRR